MGLVSGTGETVTNTVMLNEAGEIIKTTRDTAGGLVAGLAATIAWFGILREPAERLALTANLEEIHESDSLH